MSPRGRLVTSFSASSCIELPEALCHRSSRRSTQRGLENPHADVIAIIEEALSVSSVDVNFENLD